jgi:histidyl-tRNA synthetase
MQKPSIPKGTRDFTPDVMARREYIFNTIKQVYKLYGFLPIETPAMENLNTLMGKYGEEGDKLLFKILNSGDFLSKVDASLLTSGNSLKISNNISERGLRYDLTVPFARFVVQHQNEIQFPFKRYQIQPVWRADRPQKGRYREFFQCDADVIGSDSLMNEFELIQIIDEVFNRLKVNIVVKINNRKILTGLAEYIDASDKIVDITVAIDKLDKIGVEKVKEELSGKGLSNESIDKLEPVLFLKGSSLEKLNSLEEILSASETGLKGIQECRSIMNYLGNDSVQNQVELDLTLARGLNYYTGAIIEVKAKDFSIGSICGGGRYDDLTGIFGLKDVSGVGISFGADRIYDVMEGLNLFPEEAIAIPKILFINFGEQESRYSNRILSELRKNNIAGELYPDQVKMKKQMNFANKKGYEFIAIVGEAEMEKNEVALKNMKTGEQKNYSAKDLIKVLS